MSAGIFTIPREDYHADPCDQPSLSSSIAKLLCSRSPLHARTAHPRLNPDFVRQEEARFDIGTVAHALLLEDRDPLDIVSIVHANDWKTKAAQELRDAAREAGLVPLLAHQADNVVAMLEAGRAQLDEHEARPSPFTEGRAEQTLIWEEDGVTCRALLDWLRHDFTAIDDFKTTSASADPERWTRTLFTIGADIQTAFYLRGLAKVTGDNSYVREMRYVVQETYPPYALSVISLGPDVLAVANHKVEYAIDRWRECMASGEWPGYPTKVCHAELPAWEEARWMERVTMEEAA